MTERYPSFIPITDSKPDAAPSCFSDPRAVSHAPIEEPAQCPSSAAHRQAPLQHQLYDSIHYNPTSYGDPALSSGLPAHPNPNDVGYSALGISTDWSTSPQSLTALNENFNCTWNDLSFSSEIPLPGPQSIPPPRALDSAHDQTNDIPSSIQYMQGPVYSEPFNLQFQHDSAPTSDIPPPSGALLIGAHSSPFLQPDVHQISPRSDLHHPALYWPHGSSLSTPDEGMRPPVLSSGSSPSVSHHRTPSSVSSFILHTPDQNSRHLESCYQPPPYAAHHNSPRQRPVGSLAFHQVAQNASNSSTMGNKQPKTALNDTPKVFGYRRIEPAPPSYVKSQKESPSRRETKRARRGSKESPKKPRDLWFKSSAQPFPAGTVVFKTPLTPTTVKELSFDTSSRKVDERIIEKVGVNSEAGYSIAPKVQEELCRNDAPAHARTHTTEHTPAIGHTLWRQRRNSKEVRGGGSMSAHSRRTSVRSPPAKPQNSTLHNTGTLPNLGKRRKRHTTESNSSSNSSKTPTGRSRSNSHGDQKLTPSSSQQTRDSSDGRTRSVRKNSYRVGGETSVAISGPRAERASSQIGESRYRVPVHVPKERALVPSGGRSNPVGRALARPRSGPTQNESTSHRKGPTHNPDFQTGWAAPVKDRGRSSGRVLPMIDQDGSVGPEWTQYSVVDHESLMSTQTRPETGRFNAESYADNSGGSRNAVVSRDSA